GQAKSSATVDARSVRPGFQPMILQTPGSHRRPGSSMSLAVYRTPLCEPSPWPEEQARDQTFTRRSLARAGLLGRVDVVLPGRAHPGRRLLVDLVRAARPGPFRASHTRANSVGFAQLSSRAYGDGGQCRRAER